MLELGRSESWTRALETISGQVRMDAGPLLDYFKKLYDWLKVENSKHNRAVGWKSEIRSPSQNSIKVRISLKAALGDNAYPWTDNEMYLFKTSIAFALRHYYSQRNQTLNFTSANVLTYDETQRISFYIVVTNPTLTTDYIPMADLEAAIRLSRGRLNDIFRLNDETLEFVGILPTLAPPYEQPVEVWLVVFGVVMGIVVLAGIYLIFSGIRDRRKNPPKSTEKDVMNPYDDNVEGQSNKAYEDSDGEMTGF